MEKCLQNSERKLSLTQNSPLVKLLEQDKTILRQTSSHKVYLTYTLSREATGTCAPLEQGPKPKMGNTQDSENEVSTKTQEKCDLWGDGEADHR